jgi:recombination protein RecT
VSTPVETKPIRAELEKRKAPKEALKVTDLIERMKPELAKVLPATITAERLARVFTTEVRRNPTLLECNPESMLGALMLSAQLGLEPGPLGHVYLVPFKREVTFVLGYKGMIDLAYRSGLVKRVETAVVREGDSFEWRKGSRAFLDYTPAGPPGERDRVAVYALAELRTGGKPFEVLFPEQVEARRKRSPAARAESGPWLTDTDAMWRKSAVRALAPVLPQSATFAQALAADELPIIDVEATPVAEDEDDGGQA